MLKYGIDNFSFEIIEKCSQKELNEKEIYWISFFDSYRKGYNETTGGESFQTKPDYVDIVVDMLMNSNKTYKEISVETGTSVQSIGNINRGISFYNESLNYPLRPETKIVIQYSKEGVEIARFSSRKEAEAQTGISEGNIKHACLEYKDKQSTAGGFQWRYIENEGDMLHQKPKNKKRVGKFSKDDVLIKEFESAADAAREEGVLRDHISRVCRGERKTLYGFKWKYLD